MARDGNNNARADKAAPARKSAKQERRERSAEALRANLRRRKKLGKTAQKSELSGG